MNVVKAEAGPARRRSRILPLALTGLLLAACSSRAGLPVPVPVRGDTVRVTTGDGRAVHEFRELRGDVLVVEHGDSALRFPLADVDSLEALVGRRSRVRTAIAGAGIGLGIGAGMGALMGLASSTSCGSNELLCGPATNAAIAAVGLGAIGATLGLIGGATASTLVWRPVKSSALDVRARASPDGLGLRLSWRP